MSLVFEPQWTEAFKEHCQRLPKYLRPALYNFLSNPHWSKDRNKIEYWVSLFPREVQEKLGKLLRNPKQFQTTYHELIVADLIRQCGHEVEYEKMIGRKTPDWYIHAREGIPDFVVEVATIFPPEQMQKEMRLWDELRCRLEGIEHYFHLDLNVPPNTSLAGKKIKPIIRFIREWLDTLDPERTQLGHTTTYIDGDLQLEIRILPRKTKHKKAVATMGPAFTQWVNTEYLRDTLSKKLKKYRKEINTPLAVAVLPTFESGFDEDSLFDVLFGQEQVVLSLQNEQLVSTELTRDRSGMITPRFQEGQPVVLNTTLSAVLWLEVPLKMEMKVAHNPHAKRPIPLEAFAGFPNLTVVNRDERRYELGWITP